MTAEEFQKIVSHEPTLVGTLKQAASSIPSRQFGLTEAAVVVLMFPIVNYVLKNIGLPWLHETKRYSELWRQKFHRWIDEQHKKKGINPDEAEAAGEALCKELEKTTDLNARTAWERLLKLVTEASDDEGS